MDVFPLIFEPILKPRIWGGQRLGSSLRKIVPAGMTIGESWEAVQLESEQSIVAAGPAKGKSLGELMQSWGTGLTGRAKLAHGRFPLLIKYLDAAQPLSIQVHPTPEAAERSAGAARVKNEAWYVIEAEPDAWILRGLQEGVGKAELRRAVAEGRVESVLRRIPARQGHAYYLPSGTVHALGGGVLVAEVQTPSDTTYRISDWGRVDPATGRARTLHVEEALASIRYEPVPPSAEQPQHVASVWTSITSLVRCDSFFIERVRMVEGVEQPIPYEEMVVWMVIEGSGCLACRGMREPLAFGAGDTVVLPAGMKDGRVSVMERSLWLEVSVPIESSLTGFDRPDRGVLREGRGERLVPLNPPSRIAPPEPNSGPRGGGPK